MPRLDAERIAVAQQVMEELAEERRLSTLQARAFVRCLQTEWEVDTIRWRAAESDQQFHDALRLIRAGRTFREIEGATSVGARTNFQRAAQHLEWLARAQDSLSESAPILLLAAGAYQLGGLPAMATGLIQQAEEIDAGTDLYGNFLSGDFDGVLYSTTQFWLSNPTLTTPDGARQLWMEGAEFDVGWVLTVELVRALGLIADSIRRDDQPRLELALQKLASLEKAALRSAGPYLSLLISVLSQVAVEFRNASIYVPLHRLGELRPERRGELAKIARAQFRRGRGLLWASQAKGLEKLNNQRSFALCTPTGSGKTLVANLALVKELLLLAGQQFLGPLALYLVPSRALAVEVEAKLSREMGDHFLVTGLYGGNDWGITDAWLSSDRPTVLIATVEKADALMRALGPLLTARMKLLIVDEAHQVVPTDTAFAEVSFADHGDRSIRLESFVSRVLTRSPDIARIALTAVAGGAAGPVARWLEGHNEASAVGLNYRSTRQLVGIMRTQSEASARFQIDLMNGQPLRVTRIGRDAPSNVYINLRTPPMPKLPAPMRNSVYRFNQLDVLWTALHLQADDRRILISLAQEPEQTMDWYCQALALPTWRNVPAFEMPRAGSDLELFEEAVAACADYCGAGSHELTLLRRGIATSHGQMPQRLRRLMTDLIDRGICPITIATATLTEGVNLPFDIIFVPGLRRTSFDAARQQRIVAPMSAAEFANLAGRAGRPGASKGLEGITLVAIPRGAPATAPGTVPTQVRQIREMRADYAAMRNALIDAQAGGHDVASPLALLLTALADQCRRLFGLNGDAFLAWLEQTAPVDIAPNAGRGEIDARARLADTLDELDGVLLAAVEELSDSGGEEIEPTEEMLVRLWQRSFSAVAAHQEAWLERAFVRRGVSIVENIYPDADERRRLYQYGYSPQLGRRFEEVIPRALDLLAGAENYGAQSDEERFVLVRSLAAIAVEDRGFGFRVRGTEGDAAILANWEGVLRWWLGMADAPAPEVGRLRAWQRFVADNLEFRLGAALGAVLARAWSDGSGGEFTPPSLDNWKEVSGLPWAAFWIRELLRWGTLDPFVAFALSQGIEKTRADAIRRRAEFDEWLAERLLKPSAEDRIDPQQFLSWLRSLPRPARREDLSREFQAELTGTRGQRGAYTVNPIHRGNTIYWLDAAGFELARSRTPEGMSGLTLRSDYELWVGRENAIVNRVFDGRY